MAVALLWGSMSVNGNGPLVSTATAASEWNLVWSDEFEGTSVDVSKWNVRDREWGSGNNELQWYKADDVSVLDGSLVYRKLWVYNK